MQEHLFHFLHAQHHRQLILFGGTDKFEKVPGTFHGVLVEELDSAQSQGLSIAGEVPNILQVEKILTQFFFADLIWGFVAIAR